MIKKSHLLAALFLLSSASPVFAGIDNDPSDAAGHVLAIKPSLSDRERFDMLMELRRKDKDFGPNTLCAEAMELCRRDWEYTVSYCTAHRGWKLSPELKNYMPNFLAAVSGHQDQATFHQYAFVNFFLVQMLDMNLAGDALNKRMAAPLREQSAEKNSGRYYSWMKKLSGGFDYANDFRTAFLANSKVVFYQIPQFRLNYEMKAPGFIMPVYGPQGDADVKVMLDGFGSLDAHGGVLQMTVRATGFNSGELAYDQNIKQSSSRMSDHDFQHDQSQDMLCEDALDYALRYTHLKDALYSAYPEDSRERKLVQLLLWDVFHESFPRPSIDVFKEKIANSSENPPEKFDPGELSDHDEYPRVISVQNEVGLIKNALGIDFSPVPEPETPEIILKMEDDDFDDEEDAEVTPETMEKFRQSARWSSAIFKLKQEAKKLVAPYVDAFQ